MNTLPPQLRDNLSRAGDPGRWFRPSAAGESVKPEVVETLLQGVMLTPELVPVVVREARPEGPARRKALEIALRQRVAPSNNGYQAPAPSGIVALQSVPESVSIDVPAGTKPAEVIDRSSTTNCLGAETNALPVLVSETALFWPANTTPADPFETIGEPPMQATLPPATAPLNGHGRTAALITPPTGAASQNELVGGWLKRHGIALNERLAEGVRQRLCTEVNLSDATVRATMSRLRKDAGFDLSPRKGKPHTAKASLRKVAPTLPPPAAPVPEVDLGSPEAQARALVVSVCARLLAGDRDETLLLCSRLLDRAL